MAVVTRHNRTVHMLDPLQSKDSLRRCQTALQTQLLAALDTKDGVVHSTAWCFEICHLRQADLFDCGVYCLAFAILLINDVQIPDRLSADTWRRAIFVALRERYQLEDALWVAGSLEA